MPQTEIIQSNPKVVLYSASAAQTFTLWLHLKKNQLNTFFYPTSGLWLFYKISRYKPLLFFFFIYSRGTDTLWSSILEHVIELAKTNPLFHSIC